MGLAKQISIVLTKVSKFPNLCEPFPNVIPAGKEQDAILMS